MKIIVPLESTIAHPGRWKIRSDHLGLIECFGFATNRYKPVVCRYLDAESQ